MHAHTHNNYLVSLNSLILYVFLTLFPLAKEMLDGTDIKIGSVVGFPLGFEDSETKKAEATVPGGFSFYFTGVPASRVFQVLSFRR